MFSAVSVPTVEPVAVGTSWAMAILVCLGAGVAVCVETAEVLLTGGLRRGQFESLRRMASVARRCSAGS